MQAVERYPRPFRTITAVPPPGPVVPAIHKTTRRLLNRPAALDENERAQFADIQDYCPHLDALAGHVCSFAKRMPLVAASKNSMVCSPPSRATNSPNCTPSGRRIGPDPDTVGDKPSGFSNEIDTSVV
jgi:hypothetical protein